jgi:nicotinamidase-related amidase
MPVDLSEVLNPRTTAVLTMEVQRSTVGDLTSLPDLRRAVEEEGTLAHIRDLLATARRAGILVVHCTVGPDFVPGIPANYPGAAAIAKRTAGRAPQPGASDPVTDIGPSPDDVVMRRHHGVSPFTGTDLDAFLRRMGVRTVVACGVSLNVGILGLTIEAVSLGYRVAVVTDAVAGVPVEYGRAVIQNSLPFIATRLTVSDAAEVWVGGSPA